MQCRNLLVLSAVTGGVCLAAFTAAVHAKGNDPKIRVLVVTGGHDFQHDEFFEVFKSIADVEYREAKHPANGNVFEPPEKPEAHSEAFKYDVIVLYDMWQKISEEGKKNLLTILKRGKGLVAMHHCIASYQDWPEYEKLIGGKYYLAPAAGHPACTYQHDVDMHVKIVAPKHPIVAGVSDFDIHDEAYGGFAVADGVEPLLTTDHPASGKCIGWTRRYGNARVCYLELGHDAKAYENPAFRKIVGQAIRWAAGLIPPPRADADGFVSLFNGENLDGWVIMGDSAGFAVKDGVIRSEGGTGGEWLRSIRQYSDFVLKAEWRVSPNGNSGVFIRCAEGRYPWVTGSEVQISNEPRDEMHCTGSLYGSVAVKTRPDESADKWHGFEIRCEGKHVTVSSDGVKVVDVECDRVDAMKEKMLSGHIGLQDSHAPKGSYIEYRNIRIKDLTAPAAASRAADATK